MENVTELIKYIDDNLFNFDSNIIFKFKDICLKNYKYKPRFNEVNIIIHEWQNSLDDGILTLDIVRKFLTEDLLELISEIQSKYLQEAQQFEVSSSEHEILQRKIKKIAEICIKFRKSDIYTNFIDYYRNGYLN
jgi:hypothetical protein